MDHLHWRSKPALHRPVLVAAFEGWNDAGDAASGAVRYLIDRYDAQLVAEIDPEEFFDFTSTRPQAEIGDDGVRRISWPSTEIYAATLPGDGGDALLVIGTEPQLRWRTFCAQITGVAQAADCRLAVLLGALVAEVPHSRPVPVVGTVTDPALQAELGLQPSTYEGPTGVVGVLSAACREAGLPAASLWAAVPTYVPTAPSPKAALALLEHTAEVLGMWVPTTGTGRLWGTSATRAPSSTASRHPASWARPVICSQNVRQRSWGSVPMTSRASPASPGSVAA